MTHLLKFGYPLFFGVNKLTIPYRMITNRVKHTHTHTQPDKGNDGKNKILNKESNLNFWE